MGVIQTLLVRLQADATQYINDMKKAGATTTDTGTSLKGMAGQALGMIGGMAAVGAAVKAIADYMVDAEKAANDLNIAEAKQAAILKATGGASGQTTNSLKSLTDQLTNLSGVDDELIRSGESVMLTFRNIGGSEFPRAMRAALDLQTTFGSLESSSMMLGKALNDPLTGITALSRAGVTFSDEQKEQIKNFMAINDLASAQAMILSEVEAQVGGTAQAMNVASDGSARLKNAADDLSEAIGQGLIPNTRSVNNELAGYEETVAAAITVENQHRNAIMAVAAARGIDYGQMSYAMSRSQAYAAQVEFEANQIQHNADMVTFHTGEVTKDTEALIANSEQVDAAREAREKAIAEQDAEIAGWRELARAKKEYYHVTPEAPAAPLLPGGGRALTPGQGFQPAGDTRQVEGQIKNIKGITDATGGLDKSVKTLSKDQQQAIAKQIIDSTLMTTQQKEKLLSQGESWGVWTDDVLNSLLITTEGMKGFLGEWRNLLQDRTMQVTIAYKAGGGGGSPAPGAQVESKTGHYDEHGVWVSTAANGLANAGGLTVVGEEGPELVNLPSGSQVYSNPKSKEILKALPHMRMGGAGGGPAGEGEWTATVGPGSKTATESNQGGSDTKDRDRQRADDTNERKQTTKAISELKSTVAELSVTLRKMGKLEVDYNRLARAVRDGISQTGQR